jgi:hypothetical protein
MKKPEEWGVVGMEEMIKSGLFVADITNDVEFRQMIQSKIAKVVRDALKEQRRHIHTVITTIENLDDASKGRVIKAVFES